MRILTDRQLVKTIRTLIEGVDFPQRGGAGRTKAPAAKFTTTQIRAIRQLQGVVSCRVVGECLQVESSTITRIWNRQVYASVK